METLRSNVRSILAALPAGTELIPVLKDNAYGLGLEKVASVFSEMREEIRCIAVSHVSEGLILRKCGVDAEILVMGAAVPFQYERAVQANLTLACCRIGMASALAETAERLGRRAKIQIKIDTGLHRIGIEPGPELMESASELKAAADRLEILGAFSHFSDSESQRSDEVQYQRFCEAVRFLEESGIPIPRKHISSSAASELYPQFGMDAVRIGRRLYMDHPEKPLGTVRELASWRSYITEIKQRGKGDSVGYGNDAVLEQDSMIATVGVGYGDGLNQELVRVHAPVLVNGREARLTACCMDQCMIDVSGIPCSIGDEVTFFGYDGKGGFLSSQAQALLIGRDEGCGLTSALSERVARVYK